MADKLIRVKVTGKDAHAAYIALPGHRPEPGMVSKSLRLDDVIEGFHGPQVLLDFDRQRKLIGIEILCDRTPPPV